MQSFTILCDVKTHLEENLYFTSKNRRVAVHSDPPFIPSICPALQPEKIAEMALLALYDDKCLLTFIGVLSKYILQSSYV